MTLKQHFAKAADHHKTLAKSCAALVAADNELAIAAESSARPGIAKTCRAVAAAHEAMGRAHEAHAEHLAALASKSVDAGEKVAKVDSVVESFFDRMYSGKLDMPRQSHSGGLFSEGK
jgi:hypothetical protein